MRDKRNKYMVLVRHDHVKDVVVDGGKGKGKAIPLQA